MDNNNFEQQFTRNVQQTVATQPAARPTSTNNNLKSPLASKASWIVIVGLSFVILLQIVTLIIVLTNFANSPSEEPEDYVDDNSFTAYDDPNFSYDDEENLTAFNIVCDNNNGTNYSFSLDNKYTSPSGSGTYSITNSNIVILDGNTDHVLYYDGLSLIDGITIYDCEEPDAENTDAE